MVSALRSVALAKAVVAIAFGTAYAAALHAHTWGDEAAPVTLMMFSGFTCPFCAQAKTQLDTLKRKYPKDLRIVFKHFPLSNDDEATRPHLIAAAAAEQGKFWEAHDSFFERPNAKLGAEMSLLLSSRGVNVQQANVLIETGQAAKRVSQDIAEAGALKVRATPTFFVDGMRLEGLQELATLERLIEFRVKKPTSAIPVDSAVKPPTNPAKQ